MNYQEINRAILEGRDVNYKLVKKDKAFYAYLLNNRVAYYYADNLSTRPNKAEQSIISQFAKFQERYTRTLELIKKVCAKHSFEYLLYKTHRYIPEIVDGDIDIIIKSKDFDAFLKAFKEEDFAVEEDEPGKGKCVHKNYCVIEPHTNISWRANGYLKKGFIWSGKRIIAIEGKHYPTVSLDVEAIAILAKVLFEPSYFDLYCIKSLNYFYTQGIDENKMFANALQADSLRKLLNFYNKTLALPKKKLPAFLPNSTFIYCWTKNLMSSKNLHIYLLHTVYFTYWKYRYRIANKLPFTHHHEW